MVVAKHEKAIRSKRFLLLVCIAVIFVGYIIVTWVRPLVPMDVRVSIDPQNCNVYSQGGETALTINVGMKNMSGRSVWYVGKAKPQYVIEHRVNGQWTSQTDYQSGVAVLTNEENLSFIASAVNKTAKELRVGVAIIEQKRLRIPFTSLAIWIPNTPNHVLPNEIKWVFSPTVKLIHESDNSSRID